LGVECFRKAEKEKKYVKHIYKIKKRENRIELIIKQLKDNDKIKTDNKTSDRRRKNYDSDLIIKTEKL